MSTYLYLQCLDHDPPLRSEGEVGQHMTDLPFVRVCIKERNDLAKQFMGTVWPVPTTIEGQWQRTAAAFLADHRWCNIGIVDEYRQIHPIESAEERIGPVFVDFAGNRWWLNLGTYLTCAPLNEDGTPDMDRASDSPENGSDELWTHLYKFLQQAAKEQASW